MANTNSARRGVDRVRAAQEIKGLDARTLDDLGVSPSASAPSGEIGVDRPMVTHSALLWAMPSLQGR